MKERKQKNIVIFIFIVVILIILALLFYNPKVELNQDLASCIGENSALYVNDGCHYCEVQEQMFGEYSNLLNSFDCKVSFAQCSSANIQYTPTWVIDGKLYTGVQELNTLKRLTDC